MGMEAGRDGMKATWGAEGTDDTGSCPWGVNGWVGGVAAAIAGLCGGALTDLETSSNQRSASEGVRLWEGMTGEDEGGTTITGAAEGQLPPVDYKKQNVSVKMSLLDF